MCQALFPALGIQHKSKTGRAQASWIVVRRRVTGGVIRETCRGSGMYDFRLW